MLTRFQTARPSLSVLVQHVCVAQRDSRSTYEKAIQTVIGAHRVTHYSAAMLRMHFGPLLVAEGSL